MESPNPPIRLESFVQTDTILFQSLLNEFIEDFLQKSSDYFTTGLSVSSFSENLNHTWTDPHGLLRDDLASLGNLEVQWYPTQVYIGLESYDIVWALNLLNPGLPLVPEEAVPEEVVPEEVVPEEAVPEEAPPDAPPPSDSSFVEEAPPPTLACDTPATVHPVESGLDLIDLSDIPYIDNEPLDNEQSPIHRARERRLIRETRLRAELTHLRAERLAQRYLEKYAPNHEADNESVLSFPSDTE